MSVDTLVRPGGALGLRLELELVDARQRPQGVARQADPVHAAMGEFELRHLRPAGHGTALDEPYQHYQSMAALGARDIRAMQQVEMVYAPAVGDEGKSWQRGASR
ncbi:MAG: hypothetical protein ABI797_00940 [Chloroflexota bacterium]